MPSFFLFAFSNIELRQEFFKSYKYYLETQNQLGPYVDYCSSNQQAAFL